MSGALCNIALPDSLVTCVKTMANGLESTPLQDGKSRRDMLHITTGVVAAFGLGAMTWPLLGHMEPASEQTGLIIDLSKIVQGQQLKISWEGKPVFIRHRTPKEIEAARNVDLSKLPHKETDEQRLVPGLNGQTHPKYLVIIGICPHFGCVPVGEYGDYDGWYCPCHGAHFDTSGRVRKGPPPINMEIPPYRYISETSIEIF